MKDFRDKGGPTISDAITIATNLFVAVNMAGSEVTPVVPRFIIVVMLLLVAHITVAKVITQRQRIDLLYDNKTDMDALRVIGAVGFFRHVFRVALFQDPYKLYEEDQR